MANFDTPLYYISDTNSTTFAVQSAIAKADQDENVSNIAGLGKIDSTIVSGLTSGFETTLKTEVEKYLENTKSLNLQNEIYNTNMYMSQSMTMQEEQINDLSEKARNHIMRLRQKYQLKLYDINYYKFITTVLIFAIFIVAMSGMLLGFAHKHDPPALDPTISWIIVGVVITLYLVVVFIYLQNNSNRRKTDWNKYNFGTYGKNNSGSCNT